MSKNASINLHVIAHQAMANYGFLAKYPIEVIREAQKLIPQLDNGTFRKSFEDMTPLLWSSIDNVDSQDLDQLEYCEKTNRQEIHVFIAIADVDSYVEYGSAIDEHAAHNGTSVYAEVEVFPMLPERLSSDLSSLIEGKDRLAIVVDYYVLRSGELRPGGVRRAVVRNKAKLVYEPVGEWLDQEGAIPEKIQKMPDLKEQVLLQMEAANRLHQFRLNNGALELETIETSVKVEDGQVADLIIRKKNTARKIIENFMIAANRTMVACLEKSKFPYIQRILRTPERWDRIVAVAASYGEEISADPDPKALSDFLVRQHKRDPGHFPDLSISIVKLIGAAEYDLIEPGGKTNPGHFGLAVHDYTHSTAPNRRYVDIVIQRLLKAALDKKNPPYDVKTLKTIAGWCTDRDRMSKKVERFMVKVAGAVLLSGRVGEIFEGIITGASDKGTYVRLLNPPVEGRVMRNHRGMNVGDKVWVKLIKMDARQGYIDFEGARRRVS